MDSISPPEPTKIDYDAAKLYDREPQLRELQDAYSRCRQPSAKSELVLITGASGTGKSALARSLAPKIEEEEGFFLSGKFDEQIHKPHGPFLAAAEEFLTQMAYRDSQVAKAIKESITEGVGSEVFILVKAIPGLGQFLNTKEEQPEPLSDAETLDESVASGIDLDSSSSHSFKVGMSTPNPARFVAAFCLFLRAIASQKPVVLLLDDVQWIDESSLDILTALVTCSHGQTAQQNLLVVGTCRGNEVGKHDVLSIRLREIDDNETATITDIQVHSLTQSAVACLLADVLGLYYSEVLPLAEIVTGHTGGNALFVKLCLQGLVDDGVLYQELGKWKWDEAALVLALPTSSAILIVPLLAKKLRQLPADVGVLVKTIACLGSTFSEFILFHAGTLVSSQVLLALGVAADKGFVVYDVNTGMGCCTHDKFREAALSLIPSDDERDQFHLKIGRNLRRQLSTEKVKEHIILIADQLKHGLNHLSDPEEMDDFARVFLRASREAAKKSAFLAASEYIDCGLHVLSNRHWRDQYNLSLDLYSTGAELAYCIGEHEKVDALAIAVSQNARFTRDKNRALVTQLMSHASSGQPEKGLDLCWTTLKDLKEPVPRQPGLMSVLLEITLVKQAIGSKTEEDILALPELQDARIIAAMKVLYVMNNILENCKSEESAMLPVLRLVRLSFKHGLSPLAALGFHLYGLYLVKLGQLDDAYRFGRLAMRILEKFPSKQLEGQIIFLFYLIIQASKSSFRSILEPMVKAGDLAMETGFMEHGMAGTIFSSCFRMFLGDSIPCCMSMLAKYEGLCGTYRQRKLWFVASCSLQICQNLTGGARNPLSLTGDWLIEEEAIQQLQGNLEHVLIILLHCKYMMLVTMNENLSAETLHKKHAAHFQGFILPFFTVYHIFFRGLALTALARTCTGWNRRKKLAEAKRLRSKMKKWLEHCPDNITNKLHLMDAELEFCQGRFSAALLKYEQAIAYARKENFISDQAISCEKAGRMLRHAGRLSEAADYFQQARQLYQSWGAQLKVDHIEVELVKTIRE
ncbi:expressed unknown protein [Seminavis robusta]|uniref:AAA+ ATPase domain-containing protein n=1 Tax=Seminavis robusta TaxID=568900 RepID=A0A9N8ED21_9STRA|nr:expressed unknown protein [Seminavis robusta]|eukprot:Sro821_g207400.1 n/a (1034) ;mRNA; r:31107-34386